MATGATGKHQEDKHQDHDERDDSKHLHPTWCTGVAGQVSHVRILSVARGYQGHREKVYQTVRLFFEYSTSKELLWNDRFKAVRSQLSPSTRSLWL